MCLTGSAMPLRYCNVLLPIPRRGSYSSMVRFRGAYRPASPNQICTWCWNSSHPAVLVPVPQHDVQNKTVRIPETDVPRRHRRFSQSTSSHSNFRLHHWFGCPFSSPSDLNLQQNDNSTVIHFLLSTEIIPLCLRIMETGSELSKTVAIFIVQKILLDETGLTYICHTYERFYAVGTVLSNMVNQLVETQAVRLLKHVVRCYLRLSDNPR